MNVDPRHAEVKRRFHELLELAPEQREPWLAQQADAALAAELRALLCAHLAVDTAFLETPGTAAVAPIDPAALGLERGWRVLRELARGGMGVVYLAERADGAYQQQVALKLLRPDAWVTPESLLRLKLERQILARLQHPNIARLLDGGTTESGAPYLVIEYIEGERIDDWCEQHSASLQQRLGLMVKVCSAVAHAHRNLVVHRDLKPANILVDAAAEPKLLDFGIAREVAVDSSLTRAGERLLTPRYASPEQMRDQPATTLSDVYSLGVVLYELLTGESPYAVAADAPMQLMDAVCRSDPWPPSVRARQLERSATPSPVPASQLRGDLDAILLRCLAKDPAARYASVEALSADLQAVLDGSFVAARRGHRFYALRCVVRRHWIAIATTAAVLAMAAMFVVRLDQQLRETELARAQQARTLDFITELFRIADPGEARGSQVTVREVLDRGSEVLQADNALEPAARDDLLATLGLVYRQLGMLEASVGVLQRALQTPGSFNPAARARLHLELAATAIDQARFDEAASSLESAAGELGDAAAGHARLLFLRGYLALRQGRVADAEAPLDAALASLRAQQPLPARPIAEALSALGNIARERADYALAGERTHEALRLLESVNADPWSRARLHNNLAVLASDQGEFGAAERNFALALQLIESALGPEHPATAAAVQNLASVKSRRGEHVEAARLFQRALEIRSAKLGERHPQTLSTRANLAYIEYAQGEFGRARAHIDAAADALLAELGPAHLLVASARRNRVAILFAQGEIDAALRENAALIAGIGSSLGEAHPLALQARVRALAYACVGDAGCDIDGLATATTAHASKLGDGHAEVGESWAWRAFAEVIHAPARACATDAATGRLSAAGVDVAPWDRALWQWALAQCGTDDGRDARDSLQARYGAAHPLLKKVAAADDARRPRTAGLAGQRRLCRSRSPQA